MIFAHHNDNASYVVDLLKEATVVKRQVFFSFEFDKDSWRASQIRNIGKVSGESTFSDNDWEEVRRKTNVSISRWIDKQLKMRSCLIVLVGESTSTRKWVRYEIERAYWSNKGIVGIYIDRLKDRNGNQSKKGRNPFCSIKTATGEPLSKYVECFDSPYLSSAYVYQDISENIDGLIEGAIEKAGKY